MRDRIAGILDALAAGPKDLATLRLALHEQSPTIADLADVMQALVVTGLTFPCTDTAGERDGWPGLNRALVALAADEGRPDIPLACPRLGVGLIEKSATAMVMQSVLDSTSAEAAAEWGVQNIGSLRQHPALFDVDEHAEVTPVALKQFFRSAWKQYADARRPEGRRMDLLGFSRR